MRFRILLSDKDYLTSFVDMTSKIDKNLLIDLDFNGLLFDDELLIFLKDLLNFLSSSLLMT